MTTKTKKQNNNKSTLVAIWVSLLSLLFNLVSMVIQILAALLAAALPIIIFCGIWLFIQVLHLTKKPFNKPPSHNQNNTQEIRVSQKKSQLEITKKMQAVYNNNFAIDAIVILQQEALKKMSLQRPNIITNTNPIIETKQQYQPSNNNDDKKFGLTNDEIINLIGYGALALGLGAVVAASGGAALPFLALL